VSEEKRQGSRRKVDMPLEPRPSLSEVERLLNSEEDVALEILPNGEIRQKGSAAKFGIAKPLTMRENLGGEYAA